MIQFPRMNDDYPWPSAQEIEMAYEGAVTRNWSKFDVSNCRHGLMVGVTPLGVGQPDWNVEICPQCGYVESCCNHNDFQWNDEGTLLRCVVCGLDGT
jgi:hypothetical protein